MRFAWAAAVLGVMALAACDPAPEPKAPEPPIVPENRLETFEDTGCLGYLLLQRTAISEGRAQGDTAALDAAVAAWRGAGTGILSADELAQYEATSVAVQRSEPADVIAERAAGCVTSAP
jgi:hypothetical protein